MFRYLVKNQGTFWNIDDDGMLRCKTSVLISGVLKYDISELAGIDIPEKVKNKGFALLYVPPEELKDAESIKSLEGKPVKLNHAWGYSDVELDSVGNVAGTPYYSDETKLLYADILINNIDVIKKVTALNENDRLVEQSAAYYNITDWTEGVTPKGELFDGVQRKIRYNHIALLPVGQGRAGATVKIINKDLRSKDNMSFTRMKVGNSVISVKNEDADALQKEMDDKDSKIENAIDGKDLESAMTTVEELNGKIDTLTSERDTALGQLEEVKKRLDELTSPDNMSDMLTEAVQEQGDAGDILDAYNTGADGISDEMLNACKQTNKKLLGHSLRVSVVNSVRKARKQDELKDDMVKNEDIVKGMFTALKETAQMVKNTKKVVVGEKLVNALTKEVGKEGDKVYSATDRINHRFEQHKKLSKGKGGR